jgi:hypothetical protein
VASFERCSNAIYREIAGEYSQSCLPSAHTITPQKPSLWTMRDAFCANIKRRNSVLQSSTLGGQAKQIRGDKTRCCDLGVVPKQLLQRGCSVLE